MKCPFCKRKIKNKDGHHIYKCNRNKLNDRIETKFQYIKHNYPLISNKNNLYDEYIIKSRTLIELRDEYGISYRNVIFLLDYFGFKKRTRKKTKSSIKKYKKTCSEKYGVDNVSKLKINKIKKSPHYKSKKLISEIIENKKSYDWLRGELQFGRIKKYDEKDLFEKEIKEFLKRYKKYWEELNDEQKNEIMNKKESLEQKISSCFDKLNITYISNFRIGEKKFDFRIGGTNLLIDVNSDDWHSNPSLYKEDDVIHHPFKRTPISSVWEKDNRKRKYAESNNYKLIQIWENDIKNMNKDELFNFIYNLIIEKLNMV
jgi:hypothetical protein